MKNFLLYVIVSLLALLFCLEGVTLPKGGRTMQGSYSSTHQVPSAARAVGSDFLPPEEPDSAAGSPVKAAWRSPAASPGETAAVPTVSWRRNIGRALFEVSVAGLGKEAEESSLPPLTGIDSSAVRPLDMGMVNVTEGRGAYRLQLPSGGAEADVRVELPYDTALLPAGYGPRDIETYCYDGAHRVWTAIAKDTTDEGTMVVVSELHLGREWLEAAENGGGDGSEGPKSPGLEFINAVMRTPEMPETSAIAPTSLKELKAADPLEGVVMIQPPVAGNDGGASLSYPLEIPSGRQGMQPDLSLTYSSGGGNGVIGVGWDMPVPEIAVETRWGVPRYDPYYESEVYLLGGEQLLSKDASGRFDIMPHRTNRWVERKNGEVQFYPRRGEAFDSIVRHGTSPDNYWWSVTDRNGTTSYYGKRHDADTLDTTAVLQELSGMPIGKWKLTERVDVNGNRVLYSYERTDYTDGTNLGVEILLRDIFYTDKSGDSSSSPPYWIEFGYKLRTDKQLSVNTGVPENLSHVLDRISVRYLTYKDPPYTFYGDVRTYLLEYSCDGRSFYKSRLERILNNLCYIDCNVGKVRMVEDASGFKTFSYGKMGEVVEENHTFVLPGEQSPYTFRMKYSYDSWNRLQSMTYPDGEEVEYSYDQGGMLTKITGWFEEEATNLPVHPQNRGWGEGIVIDDPDPSVPITTYRYAYPYVDSIAYNRFGLKTMQLNGNGTRSTYRYDILQRMDGLGCAHPDGRIMQSLSYRYDAVGNITRMDNAATVPIIFPYSFNISTTSSWSYRYDSLYRMTGATLSFYPLDLLKASVQMIYHADGRIASKSQDYRTFIQGEPDFHNDNWNYVYGDGQPHAPVSIGEQTLTWDVNGNLLTDNGATLGWDEENRLTTYGKGTVRAFYRYDAQGERFYKNTGSTAAYGNPTLYASPYLVAAGNEYTKHYYIEDERFACRIGDGAFPDIDSAVVSNALLSAKQLEVNDAALDSIVPNQFDFLRTRQGQWSSQHTTYWQHSDHLGSASWITDTSGCAVQHLQYMPWGEPLLDYRNSSFNTRYTFSGKERDEETGYSYFGARYYNSTYSIWMSIDPMSDKYPSISPYAYCGDNPVRLTDPRGEEVEYNSFSDRVIVGLQRIFDNSFRKQFKELKKSNETYVFNFNEFGNNVFSTDGDKLYINYSINDNGKSKEAGQTIFSNLRHETTHGIQFEYGELGFENIGNNQWTAINYDIMDEYEANNNQNYGFRWKSGDGTDRDIWVNLSSDNKIKSLVNSYKNIPIETHNNANTEKLKDEKYYALPNRARSSVGKCFDQKKMLLDWYEGPLFDYKWYNVLRNDTIFGLIRYTKIDSVIICDTNVHMHGKWWLRISDDEDEIIISQYKKVHPSKKSMLNFSIGQEVQCIRKLVYDRYFRLREKHFTIGYLSYSGEIVSPKKSMKKKLLKVYLNTKQIEP